MSSNSSRRPLRPLGRPVRCGRIAAAGLMLVALGSAAPGAELRCRWPEGESSGAAVQRAAGPPADGRDPDQPRYAPGPHADFRHIIIDVTPDFDARRVSGTTTLVFTPVGLPLRQLTLHGIDLSPRAGDSSVPVQGIEVSGEEIIVTFEREIPPGEEVTLRLSHESEPRRGLYFRTPAMGYKAGDTHLWTQGEMHEARHWYPSFDYPNERFTSEMICRVPPDMTVLSNGVKASDEVDSATGMRTVRWIQDKPHVNYLIALAAGRFASLREEHRGIPMAFHTPRSQAAHAAGTFEPTMDMMRFFEREIGVPYPWDKYDQVVVDDFHYGGMENTTLTVLNDRSLNAPETENVRSSRNLIAHELVHQWFGDLITTKDWSHIWLNEGFATYYANLYEEESMGRDAMLLALRRDAEVILKAEKDGVGAPIVHRDYDDPKEQFGYRAYDKGGWVLHMLRTQLGPELYRDCVRTYLERNRFRSVVTADLILVIEELSGRSMERFFDQWIYHGGHPRLEVRHKWDEAAGLAHLSVRQTQKSDPGAMLFHIRTKVRFRVGGADHDREIMIDEREEDYYFALPGRPEVVRFDPEYGVLADVKFDKPGEMLRGQLRLPGDVIGRMRAAEELAKKDDAETIRALGAALREDEFFGVRIEAARALLGIHKPEALAELLAGRDQRDARVRLEVMRAIGGYYDPAARSALLESQGAEKNPAVRAAAIGGLDKYGDDEVREVLTGALDSESYREEVASAAMEAIGRTREPEFIIDVMSSLADREGEMPSRSVAAGLGALAKVASGEKERGVVREFLAARVNHPKLVIRLGAISALGELGDPRAVPVLETFASATADERVRTSARSALAELRGKVRAPEGVTALREDLTRLGDEHAELKKRFEELSRRLEAEREASSGEKPAEAEEAADSGGAPVPPAAD